MVVNGAPVSCNSRTCHRSRPRPPSNSLPGRTKRTKKRPSDHLLASTPSLRLSDFEEENLSLLVESGLRDARLNSDPLQGVLHSRKKHPLEPDLESNQWFGNIILLKECERRLQMSSDVSIVQVMNLTGQIFKPQ